MRITKQRATRQAVTNCMSLPKRRRANPTIKKGAKVPKKPGRIPKLKEAKDAKDNQVNTILEVSKGKGVISLPIKKGVLINAAKKIIAPTSKFKIVKLEKIVSPVLVKHTTKVNNAVNPEKKHDSRNKNRSHIPSKLVEIIAEKQNQKLEEKVGKVQRRKSSHDQSAFAISRHDLRNKIKQNVLSKGFKRLKRAKHTKIVAQKVFRAMKASSLKETTTSEISKNCKSKTAKKRTAKTIVDNAKECVKCIPMSSKETVFSEEPKHVVVLAPDIAVLTVNIGKSSSAKTTAPFFKTTLEKIILPGKEEKHHTIKKEIITTFTEIKISDSDDEKQAMKVVKEEEKRTARVAKEVGKKVTKLPKEEEKKETKLPKEEEKKIIKLTKEEEKKILKSNKEEEKKVIKLHEEDEKKVMKLPKDEEKNVLKVPKDEEKKVTKVSKEEEKKVIKLSKEDEKKAMKLLKEDEKKIPQVNKDDEKKVIKLLKEEEKKLTKLSKVEEKKVTKATKLKVDEVKNIKIEVVENINEPSKAIKPTKQKPERKEVGLSARRLKMYGFWAGPKRYREASLNALAKVHCMYENESKTALELGLLKTTTATVLSNAKDRVEEVPEPSTRTLRAAPGRGGAGRHWDMHDTTSSSSSPSSASESDKEPEETKPKIKKKTKFPAKKPSEAKKTVCKDAVTKSVVKRRRRRADVTMDLKDMVVRKRMASLNASAILAASYEAERRSPKHVRNSSDSSSSESEGPPSPGSKMTSSELQQTVIKKEEKLEVSSTPKKQVSLIVNQDTDVTITGVYVNSTTRSTHHEGFCSIAGLQYRISSTSHTQTAATAVATETLLHPPVPPTPTDTSTPTKCYTPLGALTNMKPPGNLNTVVTTQPSPSPLGRRQGCSSAFSAPPALYQGSAPLTSALPTKIEPDGGGPPCSTQQQGYYQPAGPLISSQHPVKSVLPSATPPRPSNPDSSDDVIIVSDNMSPGGAGAAGGMAGPAYQYAPTYARQIMHCPPPYPPPPPGAQYYPPYPPPDMCYGTQYTPSPQYYHTQKVYSAAPPPPAFRRYLGPYYPPSSDLYPPSGSQNSQLVSAGPSVPSLVDPYPGSHYYPGYSPAPPPCYSHSAPPRNMAYLDTSYQSCPCPMQSCPKNVHTGPLIGSTSKGPMTNQFSTNVPSDMMSAEALVKLDSTLKSETTSPDPMIKHTLPKKERMSNDICEPPELQLQQHEMITQNLFLSNSAQANTYLSTANSLQIPPLPPVALALPLDPEIGPPSPSRGSAGLGPTPSPAGAIYKPIIKPEDTQTVQPLSAACTTNRRARIGKTMARNSIANGLAASARLCNMTMCASKADYERDELKADVKKEVEHTDVEDDVVIVDHKPSDEPPSIYVEEKLVEVPKDPPPPVSSIPLLEETTYKSVKRKCPSDVEESKMDTESPLQKKRKIIAMKSINKSPTNSYKNLIKRNSKIVHINNGKQQLNVKDQLKSSFIFKTPKDILGSKNKKVFKHKSSEEPEVNIKRHKSETEDKVSAKENKSINKPNLDNSYKYNVKINTKPSSSMFNSLNFKDNVDKVIDFVVKKYKSGIGIRTENKRLLNTLNKSKNMKSNFTKHKNNKNQNSVNICHKINKSENENKTLVNKTQQVSTVVNNFNNNNCSAINNNDIVESSKALELLAVPVLLNGKCKSGKLASKSKKVKAVALKGFEAVIAPILKGCLLVPKWSNGWSWEGDRFKGRVFLNSDEPLVVRTCYTAMRHMEGDIIRPRDCVLLKSGQRKMDLPFVAKIAALWENPEDGEMMMSLLWYYRPEHTEQGRTTYDELDEVFASRHRDTNSVACVEDKCYVLTFNQYCRYRKRLRAVEQGAVIYNSLVPATSTPKSSLEHAVPLNTSTELILFCRKVYDFRQKRIVKNPS